MTRSFCLWSPTGPTKSFFYLTMPFIYFILCCLFNRIGYIFFVNAVAQIPLNTAFSFSILVFVGQWIKRKKKKKVDVDADVIAKHGHLSNIWLDWSCLMVFYLLALSWDSPIPGKCDEAQLLLKMCISPRNVNYSFNLHLGHYFCYPVAHLFIMFLYFKKLVDESNIRKGKEKEKERKIGWVFGIGSALYICSTFVEDNIIIFQFKAHFFLYTLFQCTIIMRGRQNGKRSWWGNLFRMLNEWFTDYIL